MKRTQWLLWAALLGLALALLLGSATAQTPGVVVFALAVLAAGIVANQRRIAWLLSLFFAGALLLITIGVWLYIQPAYLLVATVCALAAWDLGRFQQRIVGGLDLLAARSLETHHLTQLAGALLAGTLLAAAALSLRLELGFGLVLILAVGLILSLALALRWLRSAA